ncbi:hypothetical protein ABZT23_30515 [Streptomyces sp. NPDC005386]|uniref:hypothetical protein n=1 Tax=Streptomyces sp. NPDC005386 TaxID=3154562 RepID=UPI0033BC0F70
METQTALRNRLQALSGLTYAATDLADVQPSGQSAATRIQEIRDLATRHGIDPNGVCGRWSTQQQVKYVDELLNKGKEPSAQALWQICSGFAHGREWATLGLLERTVQSQAGNVVHVRLSSSGEVLLNMRAMTTALSAEARRLFEERRVSHQQASGIQRYSKRGGWAAVVRVAVFSAGS